MDHILDNIYISDRHDAEDRGTLEYHEIVYVITLNDDAHRYTTVHHPIVDGENPQSEFDRAVEIVREAMKQDENILVHCAAGVSRSVTTVATAIAAEEGRSFEAGLECVHESREVPDPHPDLREHAERYLSEDTGVGC